MHSLTNCLKKTKDQEDSSESTDLAQQKEFRDPKGHTKMLLLFPPSSVTSRLERAASTSSTSDSQVESCVSDDNDNLLT